MPERDPAKDSSANPGGPTDPSVPPTESGAQIDDTQDPVRRKTHESAGSDDELGRGADTPRR
jgi:hypothetical protein